MYVDVDSSEYLAQCDQRRAFISGFNGSAGQCSERKYLIILRYRKDIL